LGIGGADTGADNGARRRSDPGATAAAYRSTERSAETGAKESIADCLRIDLVAKRGDLRIGKLPACLIIIV